MVTGALEAVVLVDFAEEAFGAVRTGAVERVDLVVTSSAVVAGTVGAVVDVELTLSALEARQTVASVMTALVVARCAVSGGRKGGGSIKVYNYKSVSKEDFDQTNSQKRPRRMDPFIEMQGGI